MQHGTRHYNGAVMCPSVRPSLKARLAVAPPSRKAHGCALSAARAGSSDSIHRSTPFTRCLLGGLRLTRRAYSSTAVQWIAPQAYAREYSQYVPLPTEGSGSALTAARSPASTLAARAVSTAASSSACRAAALPATPHSQGVPRHGWYYLEAVLSSVLYSTKQSADVLSDSTKGTAQLSPWLF